MTEFHMYSQNIIIISSYILILDFERSDDVLILQ